MRTGAALGGIAGGLTGARRPARQRTRWRLDRNGRWGIDRCRDRRLHGRRTGPSPGIDRGQDGTSHGWRRDHLRRRDDGQIGTERRRSHQPRSANGVASLLTPNDIIHMHDSGVSEKVINAMQQTASSQVAAPPIAYGAPVIIRRAVRRTALFGTLHLTGVVPVRTGIITVRPVSRGASPIPIDRLTTGL